MSRLRRIVHRALPFVVLCFTVLCNPSLAGVEKTSSPVGIAVLDFAVPATASNEWAWAKGGISDLLQIELGQLGLVMLDRDLTHAVLSEQRMADGGLTAKDSIKVASLLNARYLVTGKVASLENGRFRVEADMFSVEAVEAVVTSVGEGAYPAELSRVLETVAKKIADALKATGTASAAESRKPGFTPKPEALIMFYRGLNACARGRPEMAIAWFMNSYKLDPEFGAPLLWEVKAYEMAGLKEHAEICREEITPILKRLGIVLKSETEPGGNFAKPVLAVLNPIVSVQDYAVRTALQTALAAQLKQAVMETGKFRVFAFENIGDAVAEQDLKLSSFFTKQDAPRYGRWLMSDGLLVCRVSSQEGGKAEVDLAIVNPMSGATMAHLQKTGKSTEVEALASAAAGELLGSWNERRKASEVFALPPPLEKKVPADENLQEMLSSIRNLANALERVRREPNNKEAGDALTKAFSAIGLHRHAFLSIQRDIGEPDINAPGADYNYWLLANAAKDAEDNKGIEHYKNILTKHFPKSLATASFLYRLAFAEWHKFLYMCIKPDYEDCRENASSCRIILEGLPHDGDARYNQRLAILCAYYFEGWSLLSMKKTDEAREALIQARQFSAKDNLKSDCLPGTFSISQSGDTLSYNGDFGVKVSNEIDSLLCYSEPGVLMKDLAKITDALEKIPRDDNRLFKETVDAAKENLKRCSWNPMLGLGSSSPFVQRLVRLLLEREGISSFDDPAGKSPERLLELAREVLSIYACAYDKASSYKKAEGWKLIEPLFSDRYPVEIAAKLIMEPLDDPCQYQHAMRIAVRLPRESAFALVWLKLATIYFHNLDYNGALECYKKAIASNTPVDRCEGLGTLLIELVFHEDIRDMEAVFQRHRDALGIPAGLPSWNDWFSAGRKYQEYLDLEKAVFCFRKSLELGQQSGNSSLFLAKFFMVKCLVNMGRREEAATLLREIALKATDEGNFSLKWYGGLNPTQISVLATEMLQRLHTKHDDGHGQATSGKNTNPYNVKQIKPLNTNTPSLTPLPEVKPEIALALKKMLDESRVEQPPSHVALYDGDPESMSGKTVEEENEMWLKPGSIRVKFLEKYGHDTVPAILSYIVNNSYETKSTIFGSPGLTCRSLGIGSDEFCFPDKVFRAMLDRAATKEDIPYILPLCLKYCWLINTTSRIAPEETVELVKAAWLKQAVPAELSQEGIVDASLIRGICEARLRPLYPLVLSLIGNNRFLYQIAIFEMEKALRQENSPELDEAFRDALTDCISLKAATKDYLRIKNISKLGLRYGLPESVGFLIDGLPPEQFLPILRPYINLPEKDDEALKVLCDNRSRWEWDPDKKHFRLPEPKDSAK